LGCDNPLAGEKQAAFVVEDGLRRKGRIVTGSAEAVSAAKLLMNVAN
jgi:hypothetical protein